MKVALKFIVTFVYFILLVSQIAECTTSLKHQYLLQEKISAAPCNILSSSSQPISMSQIFAAVGFSSSTTLQELTITGWYLLRGFENLKYYTIFSLHDNHTVNTKIYSLSYRYDTQIFQSSLKSSVNTISVGFLTNNSWVFIKALIVLALSSGSNDSVSVFIEKPGIPFVSASQVRISLSGEITAFSNYSIINYGYSSQALGLTPACSFIKYVVVYLDPQPFDDSVVSPMHRKQSMGTYLFWHFDLFYSITNTYKVLSSGLDQEIVDAPQLPYPDPTNFSYQNSFSTQFLMKENDNNGLIIYFEVKVINAPKTQILFNMHSYSQTVFFFCYSSGFQIWINGGWFSVLPTILFNYWYKVVIIYDTDETKKIRIYLQGATTVFKTFSLTVMNTITDISLGEAVSTLSTFIDNLRVYQGSFVGEDSTCLLYIARKQYQCLLCKSGYDLSYQNGMICIQQASPPVATTKSNIQNWTRAQCPKEQMYLNGSSSCSCRFGMYMSGSSCLLCPKYCKGCTGASSCIEQDPLRNNISNSCANNYFDDGYLCISRAYRIPNRQNFVKLLPQISSNVFSEYLMTAGELQLDLNQPFFFSFFLKSADPSNLADIEYIIAFLRDGASDIFTISLLKQQIPNSYQICLYNFLIKLKCFSVSNESIWIGLWTDLVVVKMVIQNVGIGTYETMSLPTTNFSFTDPIICVLLCQQTTGLALPPLIGSSSLSFPFTFIKGLKLPSDGKLQDFFDLQQKTAQIILSFDSMNVTASSSSLACQNKADFSSTQSVTLIFSATQVLPLQGIQSTQGVSGSMSVDIPGGKTFSVQMNLIILSIDKDITLLSYKFNSIDVLYQLISSNSFGICYIRICFPTICKQTTFSVLNIGESNFIAIIHRDLNQEVSQFFQYEFEVVCNFKRERLQFLLDSTLDLTMKKNINIPNSGIRNIYYNNMRFFEGSDFYFDYDLNDPCFMYFNLENMGCIKAKEGYSIYNYLVVLPQSCSSQISEKGTMIMYNQYTQECFDTNTVNPLCDELDEGLQTCIVCKDQNADPNNHCSCKDGFFLSASQEICIACHPKCQTCSGTYDFCTKCKYLETTVPDCGCINSSQYMDSTYQCQGCSAQCTSCQGNSNDCTECSSDRVSPPECGCNPQFYDTSIVSSTQCTPYTCDNKCVGCEFSSSSCLDCQAGRINPPYCVCEEGLFESGSECISCQSHYFYDSALQKCVECADNCKECSKNSGTCSECYETQIMVDSKCFCSDMSYFIISETGEIECYAGMNVSLQVQIIDSQFCLIYTFDENVAAIDFDKFPIDTLIFIYINQVPSEDYSVSQTIQEGKQLKLILNFKETFSASGGSTYFMQNQQFKSSDTSKLLNQAFLTKPLNFQIGPLVFASDSWNPSPSMQQLTSLLSSQDPTTMAFIRQTSIIFYFLNTLQPTVMFIMTKVTIPPKLYEVLKVISLMIFPQVENQMQVNQNSTNDFFIFQTVNVSGISVNSQVVFRRFYFSNSMALNIPIAISSTLIYAFLFLVCQIFKQVSLKNTLITKSTKAIEFLLKQFNSQNELSILLLSSSVFNQFMNLDKSSYYARIGLYAAISIIIINLYFLVYNYQYLKSQQKIIMVKNNNNIQSDSVALQSKTSTHYQQVEKLDFERNPKTVRFYFSFQIFRKYFMSMLIVFSQDYPAVLCFGCSAICCINVILSAVTRPYKNLVDNLAKILGEICLLISWSIYLFRFLPFHNLIQQQITISKEEVNNFMEYGNVVLISLVIFNSLFLISFFWSIVGNLISRIKAKKTKSKENEEEKPLYFFEYNQQYFNRDSRMRASTQLTYLTEGSAKKY